MDAREKALIDQLSQENPELKALVDEHQSLESQLDEMNRRPYLSPEDDLERKKIQKAKLAAKDRIHTIIAAHQS
ncbi:DUF465 domain-containing protein [Deltaproteobacteria bacterium Smac51]|nr:DUF465 domain-containing protein [Deltaproteobacteria bacterium Smac51]